MPEVLSRAAPSVSPKHANPGGELLQGQAHAGCGAGTRGLESWPGAGKRDSEAMASTRIRKGKKFIVLPARWCCKV